MPSRLVNLQRPLRWNDFGTPRPGPDPPPGAIATAAQTRATHSHSFNAERVPGTSHPPQFRLRDDVTVTVLLQHTQIFVNAWVFRRPTSFQDDLLHHEQGHYDLVALFCRDMFIDIMALKTQTFGAPADVIHAVEGVMTPYDQLIAAVHAPYDADAQHGRNAAQQRRWDGFIQTAFTQARNPEVDAPDGNPYKVTLASVLRGGGVSI